jgi:hypothetical protein
MPDEAKLTPFNLDEFSDELRRWLYERVVEIQFNPRDPTVPYTADDAELQVVRFSGRWFAVWRDPEQPATLPDRLHLQIMRIEASRAHPRQIELHAI